MADSFISNDQFDERFPPDRDPVEVQEPGGVFEVADLPGSVGDGAFEFAHPGEDDVVQREGLEPHTGHG